ncbi:acyl-CoA dehydrogenase family protein [Sphingobium sufflavum]|uniref:acyl-CoA dehydrogenase family protein n=1 Tax=Sphingobium sufflavum TaxID=1129547 RepID=UPI001F1ECB4A|nr:acyl-CoA dehydrogenase family protein [Sphingobium sufflavum]MCE7796685.1 acyl-CoA dehydrogenase family protein [Sphingobium sufflavum]
MPTELLEPVPAASAAAPVTPDSAPAPRLSREEILAGLPAVAARVAEGAAEREREGRLPHELFRYLRTTGITWLRVPQSLGGPGGSTSDQIEVTCAIAAADSGVAHALRGHFGFLESIGLDPDGDTSRQFAGEVLAGKLFGGANMEIGTPRPNMIRTTLHREGDHYRLNGHKYYATGAIFADYTSFSAVDEEGKPTGVLIPAGREGVEIRDDWDGMGQRLSASGSVFLNNVRVEAHEVGARRGAGSPFVKRHGAVRAQLHLYAVVAGIARNVLSDAIAYVRGQARSAKHSASATAGGDHFVQLAVGEIAALSHTIDALVAETARGLDASAAAILSNAADIEDVVFAMQLANSKGQFMIGKLALRAAELLFDTGGGSATARGRNFDRHWRNVRTLCNHNPASLRGRVLGDYYLNGVRDDFDEGRVF